MRRRLFIAGLASLLCGFSPDRKRRRRPVRRRPGGARGGKSFGDIMESVSRRYPGKVLGADRGRRDGRATYRLKILTETGDVLSVETDAASGDILSVRGRGR